MQNFEKPLHEFTDNELQQRVNQWNPRFGALALYELQRRQQKQNSEQVSDLIIEIKKLKKLTDQNAESSKQSAGSANRLARNAIYIALASVIAQVFLSIHLETSCGMTETSADNSFTLHRDCRKEFNLGPLFHIWQINDFKTSNPPPYVYK